MSKIAKKIISGILSFITMATTIIGFSTTVFGTADFKAYTPYELTAAQIQQDQTHPYGSALLTFKIDNLPRDTGKIEDTLHWYVVIDKKIGDADWVNVDNIETDTFLDNNEKSPGVFSYEQLWNEDYQWDGSKTISFRVSVKLDDIVGNAGGSSSYSNIASIGLKSSSWAVPEMKKAQELGLIPAILEGVDLTKPVTREEFCELAVLLYEKTTGKTSDPASPNPFNDTTNPQILKAFKLGVVYGTSATTFEPKKLINREQCAAMLYRDIKIIKPDGDYSIEGVKDFPDQMYISGYAVEATKYMSKIGIITGDSKGNFMPKATTNAQEAAGYGMATREQAIALTVRTYEKAGN